MYRKRIGYLLAAAALLLAGIVGALGYSAAPAFAGRPMDEEHWDGGARHRAGVSTPVLLAGFKTRSGGTEVSI